MSLLPRPTKRNQHHTVTFTDPDLTDTYCDQRSTSSRASHASSPNNRHPRGDSPISLRGANGRRGDGASTSGSSSRMGSGSEGGRTMPELSKLMAFLDDDGDAEDDTRPLGGYTSPAPRAGSAHAAVNLGSARGSGKPMSSTPPPPAQAAVQQSPTTTSQLGDHSVTSPSIRAQSRSQIRAASRQSAPSLVNAEPRRLNMEGEELPDSPSPLPGSMASMSLGLRRSNSALGERDSREGDRRNEVTSPREQEGEVTVRYEGWEGNAAGTRGGANGSTSSAERDDVSKLAEDVLHEFNSIVNSNHASPLARPGSRMRNIPSPPRSLSPRSLSPAHQMPTDFVPRDVRSTSSRSSAEGAEASRGKRALGAWRAANGHSSAQQQAPPPPTDSLVNELQDARAHIARLQNELSSIRQSVGQLRDHPDSRPPPSLNSYAPSSHPHPPQGPTLHGTPRSTLEVAQHLLALLPPHSAAQLNSLDLPSPMLDSVALALGFVREVDGLVHLGAESRGKGMRRDEDVFRRENLDGLLRRLEGWERVVRVGDGERRR